MEFCRKDFYPCLPKLQTERQSDQCLKEVYRQMEKANIYVCVRTCTQFNSVTQLPHKPISELIFSAGLLQVQFQNTSNTKWKMGVINYKGNLSIKQKFSLPLLLNKGRCLFLDISPKFRVM